MPETRFSPLGEMYSSVTGFIVLYHGTSSHRAGNIKRVGLSPSGRFELNYTLTESPRIARSYAEYAAIREMRKGAKPVVLTIRLPRELANEYLFPRGVHLSMVAGGLTEHGVYALRKRIPPRFIR